MKAKYLVCVLLTTVMCACGDNRTDEKNEINTGFNQLDTAQ